MPVESVGSLAPLPRLQPLAAPQQAQESAPAGGFAEVLNTVLGANQRANATADAAIADLASGRAEDLHTVTLALAQADTSFRLLLEIRNRVTEAFQEVSRMQV